MTALRTLGQAILQETALDELETRDPLRALVAPALRYPVYRRLAQKLAANSWAPNALTAIQWESDMGLPPDWAFEMTQALARPHAKVPYRG